MASQTNQPNTVRQDSTFWSSVVAEAPGAFNVSRGLMGIAQSSNPLEGAIQAGRTFGLLQNEYPGMFTNPQQNPTMQTVNEYGGMAAKYANPALNAYNFLGSAKNGKFANAAVSGGMVYNDAINFGLIKGTPINQGYLGAAAGGLNVYQGFKDKNYVQAGVGGAQLYDAGSTLANGGSAASGAGNSMGSIGSYAGAAFSAYNTGKILANDSSPAQDRAEAAAVEGYKGVAAYATSGLTAVADYALNKISPKGGELVDKSISNYLTVMYPGFTQALAAGLKQVGSSKGDRQIVRDSYRKSAVEAGIMTPDFKMELADGITFDAGADGSELDAKKISKQEGFGEAAAMADTIVAGMGIQGKHREAVALLFTKAALSKGDSKKNLQAIAGKHGLSGDAIQDKLDEQKKSGDITDNEYETWSAKAKDVFGGRGPAKDLSEVKTPEGEESAPEQKPLPKETATNVKDYARFNEIPVGKSFRVPGDPNRYTVQEDGTIIGTLMGSTTKPDFSKPPEFIDSQNTPSEINFDQIKRSSTKSPGIGLDGKRITSKKAK